MLLLGTNTTNILAIWPGIGKNVSNYGGMSTQCISLFNQNTILDGL
jgi:hypothetical protein